MQAQTRIHTHTNCKQGAAYNCQICNLTLQGIPKTSTKNEFHIRIPMMQAKKRNLYTHEFQARVAL
jgi:hypothetical protein